MDTKNETFFFLNAHGAEKPNTYIIPNGVRVIMFCHSKVLDVCPRFDRFNWEHILLEENTSINYNNFLKTISQYSSIKDHFCIYEGGDTIYNLDIWDDKHFRSGLYRLPVKGYAYDKQNDTIVLSEGTSMSDVINDPNLNSFIKNKNKRTHIKIDTKRVVQLLKNQNDVGIIQSEIKKIHKTKLSNLINSLKINVDKFTILLMVCKNRYMSKNYTTDVSIGKKISEELYKIKN